MKVFIDTNVIVDFCTAREPFFRDAAIIIDMARDGLIEMVVSSLTFVNVAYVMRKHYPKAEVLRKINALMDICDISAINRSTLRNAIKSEARDFEDAIQFFSLKEHNVDVIITRDCEGFKDFEASIATPQEFLKNCID